LKKENSDGTTEYVPSYSQIRRIVKENMHRWAPEQIRHEVELDRMSEIVKEMSRSQQFISTFDTEVVHAGKTNLDWDTVFGTQNHQVQGQQKQEQRSQQVQQPQGQQSQPQQPRTADAVYATPLPYPSGARSQAPSSPVTPADVSAEVERIMRSLPKISGPKPAEGAIEAIKEVASVSVQPAPVVTEADPGWLDKMLSSLKDLGGRITQKQHEQKDQQERDEAVKRTAAVEATAAGLYGWKTAEVSKQSASRDANGSTSVKPEASATPVPVHRPGMGMSRSSTATRTTETESSSGTKLSLSQRAANINQVESPQMTRTRTGDSDRNR
jgi:hypothetical protein